MLFCVSDIQFDQFFEGVLRNNAARMFLEIGFVGFGESFTVSIFGKLVADLVKFFRTLPGLMKYQLIAAVFTETV